MTIGLAPLSSSLQWKAHPGRSVTVYSIPGSYADRRASEVASNAQRAVDELSKLLSPDADRRTEMLKIYVVDPRVDGLNASASNVENPISGATCEGDFIVYVLQPDAPAEPIVKPITPLLISHWFGEDAASARAIVEGIGCFVASKIQAGPSVAESDAWVRDEIKARRPISVLSSISASESAADPNAHAMAFTSFTSYLIANYGWASVRTLLTGYDRNRPDQSVIAVYYHPMGVLQENWLSALRKKAGGKDVLQTLIPQLLPLLRPYRRQQAELVLLLLVAAGTNVAPPVLIKQITNLIKHHSGNVLPPEFWNFIGILISVYIINALVSMRRAYAINSLNLTILNNLQMRMFALLQRLPHSYYSRAKLGDVMSRLTGDLDNVQTALAQLTNKGIYQIVLLMCGIFALFFTATNWVLRLSILSIIPLFWVTYSLLRSHNKAASQEQRARVGQTSSTAQEILAAQAQGVIKAFGMEDRVTAQYGNRIDVQRRSKLKLTMLSALTDLSEDSATALAQVLIFAVGGWMVMKHIGKMEEGDLVGSALLIKYILGPVASLSGIGQTLQQATGAMDRVTEIFEEPVLLEDKPNALPLPPVSGAVEMEGIQFGYESHRPILRNISLKIPAGANVAFVGTSGSGKSTIINLLLRFYDPDGGRLTFDGHDARDVTLASLRGQIGLVFQETFIFDTTVRENIAIGRPEATNEEIEAAAKGAQLHADIMRMSEGYDTVLGERGVRMSGGQKQRLAIARAILRDPRIMILDEATAALDAKTEAGILETFSTLSKGRTTISITHRLSWAAGADTIFVLDGGAIVEQGTHAELVGSGGLYQRLYHEQTGYATETLISAGDAETEKLRAIPLFAGVSPSALSTIANQFSQEWFAPGRLVVQQGDPADKLYLIRSGSADVVLASPNGDERKINSLSDGDFFGEMGILADLPRSATIRTTAPCEMYSLTRANFLALLDRESSVSAAIRTAVEARKGVLNTVSTPGTAKQS